MSVELWIGLEFDTSHERRVLDQFVGDMNDKFGQRDELYLILANYYIEGRQVDLTVLKRDAIVVIELKECSDPFRAVENGDWLTIPDGRQVGTGGQNPFGQAKDYRFRWMDLLSEKKDEILPSGKAQSMNFSHVSAFVAISPMLHEDTKNDLSSHLPWFRLVGLDELSTAVSQQTSRYLNFSDQELRILVADVMNLTPVSISHQGVHGDSAGTSDQMNIQTSLSAKQRPIALEILKGMRKGVPPSEYVELYTVGRENLMDYFDETFNEIREYGHSDVKFVQADFGGGKTHFIDLLENLALQKKFIVSNVSLDSKEAPFDKLNIVISRIMSLIVTPSHRTNGLESLLNEWSESQADKTSSAMYEDIERLPLFPDFRMKLVEYATARNDPHGVRYEACQRALKWFRGEETPSKRFKSVKEYLAAFITFIRHLGYSGFTIMLDEAEAITSLSRITNRDAANENIRQIIDNDTNTEGFYFVFASTPTFLSGEGIHGAQDYGALWRRIRPALGQLRLSSLESVIIELPALSDDQRKQLATRIRELYQLGYDCDLSIVQDAHLEALVEYVKRRTIQENVDALVRSTIALLDEARKNTSLDPMTRYEAVVESILKDQEQRLAGGAAYG